MNTWEDNMDNNDVTVKDFMATKLRRWDEMIRWILQTTS